MPLRQVLARLASVKRGRTCAAGDFESTLDTDNIDGLTDEQLKTLYSWQNFYKAHEQYKWLGFVVGRCVLKSVRHGFSIAAHARFYDDQGRCTEYCQVFTSRGAVDRAYSFRKVNLIPLCDKRCAASTENR